MHRKVLKLLLAIFMMIGSLSGCGSASNDEAETSAQAAEDEDVKQMEEDAAAKEADAIEYYEAGRAYLYGLDGKEVDLESAYTNFEKAAELGNANAMTSIGWMYNNGNGVEQDYAVAMEWYEKAAELGDVIAMYNIGWAYDCGNGVEQDYTVAMEWYEKAADLGDDVAMTNIGNMYFDGNGVEQDYAAAMEWYEKAAELAL